MDKIAHFFSWILSPILMPTYAVILCMWITVLSVLPLSLRWTVVGTVFLITCVVPALAIMLMYWMGIISGPGLNNRTERYIPYVITMLCYFGAAFYMHRIHAPMWMTMFMVGGGAAALLSCIVNIWWKISAHAAAMGGLTALTFRIAIDGVYIHPIMPWVLCTVVLCGVLGTSRLVLERHTLGQVIAGTANGFIWVYLLTMIE